jgi:ankyrin repeat protein
MNTLVDKNPQNASGQTPYHFASLRGQLEICREFLKTLADKNPVNLEGFTPLHYAAAAGHLEVCKVILESIEDKNPAANNGYTIFHGAAHRGQLEIIRLLIDNEVDRRPIYNGETPIQLAASYGHFRSCLLLMSNFQDIVSIFKGIGNFHPYKAGLCVLIFGIVLGVIVGIIIEMSLNHRNLSIIDYF